MTDIVPQKAQANPLVDLRSKTPARIFVGGDQAAYRTETSLGLRRDHAAAVDAVWREFDLSGDFDPQFVASRNLFTIQTQATTKREYLLRPDLGRRLSEESRSTLATRCPANCDIQIAIGDGLSSSAVATQVPELLPLLEERFRSLGWSVGQTFAVRYCRVGVINEIGDALKPRVLVLLIGERPGLATADSLSVYMAYQPCPGHTDANRNLVSNIHSAGLSCSQATDRIALLVKAMLTKQKSGTGLQLESDRLTHGD